MIAWGTVSFRAMAAALVVAAPLSLSGPAWAAPQAPAPAMAGDAQRMHDLEAEVIALEGAGRFRESQAVLDRLIDMEIAAYGPHDARVGNSLSFRASLLERQGDLTGAEMARRGEIDIRRRVGDAMALADAQLSLAVNLGLQQRAADALAALDGVVIDAAAPAAAPLRQRRALTQADSLAALGRADEARAILASADAESAAVDGAGDQGSQLLPARVAHALAVALLDAGSAAEAQDPARRACVAAIAAAPAQADLRSAACFTLAVVLDDLDRDAEALSWARQALTAEGELDAAVLHPSNRARAARLAAGAEDDPDHERYLRLAMDAEAEAAPGSADWAAAANLLALWLTKTHRPVEAEPLLQQAAAAYADALGPEADHALIVRGNRVDALNKSGRADEAETEALALLPRLGARDDLVGLRYVLLAALARRPSEAEALIRGLIATYEGMDGDTRARRVDLYSRMANLASNRSDWDTALDWRSRVLDLERAEGATGRDLMTATAYYGRAALEARDYVVAYRYLSDAGDLLETYEDTDPARRASDRLYLARHLSLAAFHQGHQDEADRLSQEALDAARTPPVNAQTEISVLMVRSDLMSARSDLAAAEAYLQQALAVARGEDDAGDSAAVVQSQLSALWKMQGRYEEAETAMRSVIDHARRTHGTESLATAVPLKNLALLLSETGRSDRALPLLQQAAAIEETWLPSDNAERMVTQVRLATLMTDAGQAEAALVLLNDIADQAETRLGAGHWVSLQARERVGWALARLERYEEAGTHFQRTVLAIEDTKGPDAFELMGPLQALAYARYMDGQYDETLAVMRRSAAVGDTGGGRWRGSLSTVKSNLGVTLMALGRPREALDPLREAAELSRQGVISRAGEGVMQIDPDRFAFRKLVQALFLSAQPG